MSDKDERREAWDAIPSRERMRIQRERDLERLNDPEYNSAIARRASKRMMRVEEFPPSVRQVIYEHGLEVVQEFWNFGITKPRSIEHLIDTVLAANFPEGSTRFKLNKGPNAKQNPTNIDDEYYTVSSGNRK